MEIETVRASLVLGWAWSLSQRELALRLCCVGWPGARAGWKLVSTGDGLNFRSIGADLVLGWIESVSLW